MCVCVATMLLPCSINLLPAAAREGDVGRALLLAGAMFGAPANHMVAVSLPKRWYVLCTVSFADYALGFVVDADDHAVATWTWNAAEGSTDAGLVTDDVRARRVCKEHLRFDVRRGCHVPHVFEDDEAVTS